MTDSVTRRTRAFAKERLLGGAKDAEDADDALAAEDTAAGRHEALRAAGLHRWWLPPTLGGLSLRDGVDLIDELAYGDASYAFSSLVSVIGASVTWLYGEGGLAERLLPGLAERGGRFATVATERAAGSELDRITTTATHKDDTVAVTGEKLFSTNAAEAELLLVAARREGGGADAAPFVLVVVPGDTEGVTVGPRWRTSGLAASPVHPVTFADCRVPHGNVLAGHGLRLLEVGLNASRVLIAATAVGIARRLRDLCLDYATKKTVGGSPLARHPLFGDKMARAEVTIEAMRALCRTAATEYDAIMAGPDPATVFARRGALKSAIVAKVFCGSAGQSVASAASEVFGGIGYTDEVPIGALLRDMRYVGLVEGGEDVLRDLIYRRHVVPQTRRA
jgi:alkylation response protein AidB-like acyl-CoA dehydrogenase